MKCQNLFSGKNKNISVCHLLKMPRVLNVKSQFYVHSVLRLLLWNGIIFCNTVDSRYLKFQGTL